ncbi:aldo/keto reductase [Nocardia amamiensis]|uniref:aldo/keto reductase n=1 Tax=Nocardia amamiensis TaxID=404578 RepID=UPI0034034C8E
MEQRRLGSHGLEVSALGLGTMGMAYAYGPSDRDESIATIRRVTLFDTAEVYGRGTGSNEQLLGGAVRDFRDEVVLAAPQRIQHVIGDTGAGENVGIGGQHARDGEREVLIAQNDRARTG